MYKLIKTLAPLVLVVFFSTNVFATMIYQEVQYNQDIKYKVYYESVGFVSDFTYMPKTDDKFTVNMKAFYKDYLFKDIKLANAGAFSYTSSDYQYGDFVFYLKAPSTPGTYLCTFEGITANEEKFAFSVPIKVDDQEKISFLEKTERAIGPIGTIIGILVMVGIVYGVAIQK